MNSNDPIALGTPGRMPVLCANGCEHCGTDTLPLVSFDAQLVCDPCIRIGMCKACREHFAMTGEDECKACAVARYVADPAEFTDALSRGWLADADGREIVRRVNERLGADRLFVLVHYRRELADAREAV
jgi:hypothetical protein